MKNKKRIAHNKTWTPNSLSPWDVDIPVWPSTPDDMMERKLHLFHYHFLYYSLCSQSINYSLSKFQKWSLWSSVSSTKKDINTQLAKAWTAIDRLSVIWKSDLTDKMKHSSSKLWLCRYCYMDALHGRWLNGWRKGLMATTQECCKQFWTSLGGNTQQSSSCMVTYENYQS